SLDADSRGRDGRLAEGLYYTWTPEEVDAALGGGEPAALVRAYYGVSQAGNLEGRSVLAVTRPIGEVAAALRLDEARAQHMLLEARPRLLAARERRPHPLRDRKLITGWNGLMISALVRAARVLERGGDPERGYLAAAIRAGRGLVAAASAPGGLGRVWAAHGGAPVKTLEDHAFAMAGL